MKVGGYPFGGSSGGDIWGCQRAWERGLIWGCSGIWRGDRRNSSVAVSPSSECSLASSLQPSISPSLTHVSDGSEGRRPQLFVSCPMLSSPHPHILALKSLVPVAAALPFTFIRWRHCKGQLRPALSDKGAAWILFDLSMILGQTGGRPTRRRVGMITRVLREEERGREDGDDEGLFGGGLWIWDVTDSAVIGNDGHYRENAGGHSPPLAGSAKGRGSCTIDLILIRGQVWDWAHCDCQPLLHRAAKTPQLLCFTRSRRETN